MMTGVCGEEQMQQAAALGANSYTLKPANAEQFLRTVLASTTYWLTIHQYPTHHLPAVACRGEICCGIDLSGRLSGRWNYRKSSYAGPRTTRARPPTRQEVPEMPKQRLLIIEDDADQRELIRETLDDYFGPGTCNGVGSL